MALKFYPDAWYIQLRFSLGMGRKARWSKWTLPERRTAGYFDEHDAMVSLRSSQEEFVPQDSMLEFRAVRGRELLRHRPYLRSSNDKPQAKSSPLARIIDREGERPLATVFSVECPRDARRTR